MKPLSYFKNPIERLIIRHILKALYITKNTLANAVLAQTSTTGEESGSNSGNNNSVCKVSWIAQIGGRGILLECSASCPTPQRAECKQNNCKYIV
ncbi:MAG: hypothetical protein PARBA_00540 [Parabacteroides sp.]